MLHSMFSFGTTLGPITILHFLAADYFYVPPEVDLRDAPTKELHNRYVAR